VHAARRDQPRKLVVDGGGHRFVPMTLWTRPFVLDPA
jgi:hypothetical protein